MRKDLRPHIAHRPLADHARCPTLGIADPELQHQQARIDRDHPAQTLGVAGQDVVVDGDFGEKGAGLLHGGGRRNQRQSQEHPARIGPQIAQQTGQEPRIYARVIDRLFRAHNSLNSSTKCCRRYISA